MESCDLCGKKRELVDAIVEGSMVRVCGNCSKYGEVIVIPGKEAVHEVFDNKQDDEIESVNSNYSNIVKMAREKKHLTQETLARDIGEKESVIHQIESGKLKPNFKISKKLEFYLGIKLIEKHEKIDYKRETKDIDFKDKTLTISDLLKRDKPKALK